MKRSYLAAVGVGVLAGLRSLSAPALVSRYLAKDDLKNAGVLGQALSSPFVSRSLQAGAAAEMAADKTRFVPDRIAWPSLVWRAISGAVAGAVVMEAAGQSPVAGGAIGAAAAVGSTYGGYYLRQALHDRLHLPDRMLGAAEDSLVFGAGRRLLAAK